MVINLLRRPRRCTFLNCIVLKPPDGYAVLPAGAGGVQLGACGPPSVGTSEG